MPTIVSKNFRAQGKGYASGEVVPVEVVAAIPPHICAAHFAAGRLRDVSEAEAVDSCKRLDEKNVKDAVDKLSYRVRDLRKKADAIKIKLITAREVVANLEAELDRLAKEIVEAENELMSMGGHFTQQPVEVPPTPDPEPEPDPEPQPPDFRPDLEKMSKRKMVAMAADDLGVSIAKALDKDQIIEALIPYLESRWRKKQRAEAEEESDQPSDAEAVDID